MSMAYLMTLKYAVLTILCVALNTVVHAQFFYPRNATSIPVFRSKNDSLRLAQVESSLSKLSSQLPLKGYKIDSLLALQRKIMSEGIIRYRRIYRPAKDYITVDSLLKIDDFSAIKRVSISNTSTIPSQLLQCKNLEALELVNTFIDKLPDKLNELTHLTTLAIYNNQPKKVFKPGKSDHIKNLTIRNENARLLPRSYKKLSSLQRLDLAENEIIKFPNGARRNKKLTELILQRNNITLKKGRIKSYPYLENLALQNNKIEEVPASIRKFKSLKKLRFNNNKITRVHSAIRKLRQLDQLSFYNNKLKAIPTGVYKLSSLTEIDLFYNQIETIEPSFIRWKNLRTLYLANNRILELPENINELIVLEGLYLWDNSLTKLPESLGDIKTLKYIRVNHNYLKSLPSSILKLENLEELDISHNYISQIPQEIFDYRNFKIFALTNNPWDDSTRKFLQTKINELRAREVFVHGLSDE